MANQALILWGTPHSLYTGKVRSHLIKKGMVPVTPLQRVVARLLDGYGSECLLPEAMHYRWSYRQEQEHFLQAEFGRALHCGPDRQAQRASSAGHDPVSMARRHHAPRQHAARPAALRAGASEARALSGTARAGFESLLERLGGGDMMRVRLIRPLLRQDYVLVLG